MEAQLRQRIAKRAEEEAEFKKLQERFRASLDHKNLSWNDDELKVAKKFARLLKGEKRKSGDKTYIAFMTSISKADRETMYWEARLDRREPEGKSSAAASEGPNIRDFTEILECDEMTREVE